MRVEEQAIQVASENAQQTYLALDGLFHRHDPRLVLISGNDCGFIAEQRQQLPAQWDVLPLFSPLWTPEYNGGSIAGSGAMNAYSEHQPVLYDRPAHGSTVNLDVVLAIANHFHRLWGGGIMIAWGCLMWTLTRWTQKRLVAQYQRYNQRYWDGKLEPYNIKIGTCRRCQGFVHHGSLTITIDVADHVSDDDVRLTLLHEMVHVAVFDLPAHSFVFWQEVDRILGAGAPPGLVFPVPRQLRKILRDHLRPVELYHCKIAVRKMAAKHNRLRAQERKADREIRIEENLKKEYKEALDKFRVAAGSLTWTQALTRIGPEAGLINESGRPRGRRNAKSLAFMKSIFLRERRWHLRNAKRKRVRERLRTLLEEKQ